MTETRKRRLPKKYLALAFLVLAFLLGALLSEVAGRQFGFPKAPGTFLSWNVGLLSWQLVDAVGGDLFGMKHWWVIRLVRGLLHGAILMTGVWIVDRLVRMFGGYRTRVASFVLVAGAYSALLLFALPIKEFLHVSRASDVRSPIDTWLMEGETIFGRDTNLGRRRPVLFLWTGSGTFRELLGEGDLLRRVQLVFLNAGFEITFSPYLASHSAASRSLARDYLVMATTDRKLAESLRKGQSLKSVLNEARNGKLKLLQLDPSEHAAGLATLLLEARIEGTIKSERGRIDETAWDQLLQWLPQRVTLLRPRFGQLIYPSGQMGDAEGIAAIKQPGGIVLLSEASCAALRRSGLGLHAAYPLEGTMVLDYPAILPSWGTGERREVAQKFLDFLSSPKGQKLKESSGLDGKCVGHEPSEVLAAPAPEAVRALLNAWLERTKPSTSGTN